MPPFQGSELYRTRDQIVAAFIQAFQGAIPDIWLGEDGTLRIVIEIESGQIEGLYLANQIVLEDMFIQTASIAGLQRYGEQLGVPQILGTPAIGQLLFAGSGGTYIPIGSEVAFDPGGGGDILNFITTQDGTITNPGIPTAPTTADASEAGDLTGTFEYVAAFLTSNGETLPGAESDAVIVSDSQVLLSDIPLGGPGTTGRQIYRSQDNGPYQLVNEIDDNVTTTWQDNQVDPISGEGPENVSTAEQILLNAQSEDNGLDFNAVARSITILTNVPDGITSVINPSPFTGGSDVENIDHYRQRLLQWTRSPQTGSPEDLVNWAETVPGVESATCFPNKDLDNNDAPGSATVRISGPGNTVPGSDVVDAVLALLQQKTLANITILVGTYTPLSQDVSATVTPKTGFIVDDISASVEEAISNYIASVDVGGTLYISGIVQFVMELNTVADVVVTDPATNQTSGPTEKFVAGTITIS